MKINQELINNHRSCWFQKLIERYSLESKKNWVDALGESLFQDEAVQKSRIKTLSLFSGAGGLDIGFHQAGFDIVECNELEKDFSETLRLNSGKQTFFGETSVVCRDIKEYNPDLEGIDFIIGGPPCQTFSAAGARTAGVNGLDDDRGNLFREYVRILTKLKPKGFLFENVYRIVGAQKGKAWEAIKFAFEDCGYRLFWRVLDSADYGVPQHRERLIIVGVKEGEFLFPRPTHGPDSCYKREYYSAGEAISGVATEFESKPLTGRHGHLLDDIPPGLNYSFYTEKMGHPNPVFGWRTKFSDYLYKAAPDRPIRTLKAQGGQYTGPFHWRNRAFSVEELKRLQTFPDNYQLYGSKRRVIHQLGNSVPPQFARMLALSIKKQLFGVDMPFLIELLSSHEELSFRKHKRKLTSHYQDVAREAIFKLFNKAENKLRRSSSHFYLKIGDDFSIQTYDKYVLNSKKISYEIFEDQCSVCLGEKVNDLAYKVVINISGESATLKRVVLGSDESLLGSVVYLWRALEFIVKRYLSKDDLVQFLGYYKNSNKINQLVVGDVGANKTEHTLSLITGMVGVGVIMHENELADLYSLSVKELRSALVDIKNMGYEVRSRKTNIQIEHGYYLIPYAFPSLNERSLLRYKEI